MLTNDVVESSATTSSVRKDILLERLNKRNKDRLNCIDVKLEQRNKENLQLEGIDYFSQTFAERSHDIETRIENIIESAAKKSNKTEDIQSINNIARLFVDIKLEIQELQNYLTSSTMFLTDFKIKSSQNILNDLMTKNEETRLKLLPKKKFGFSGRKIATKSLVNPKISTADKLDKGEKSIMSSDKTFTWTVSNRENEFICLYGDEVNGKDITISNLTNCFLQLHGHAGSVQISKANNCVILTGPISRSFFAENLQDCTLALACQQLRLHTSKQCRFYIHVTCRAIIEDSKEIGIAAYNYDYADIDVDFDKAGLNKFQNNFKDVADFNWLSPDVHSPNWQLLKECDEPKWTDLRTKFKEKFVDNKKL